MKKYCVYLTIIFFSSLSAYDPLLVVVLMVKNEAAVIQKTLETLITPPVDMHQLGFFIFDTGSTDETIAQAEDFFNKHHIDNKIIMQEPFIDYATSRNRALDLAQKAFPDACFMVMPDAEWYMACPELLMKFCEEHQNDSAAYYLIHIMDADTAIDFFTPRLIRVGSGARFVGAIHEAIPGPVGGRVSRDCYFLYSPTRYGKIKSKDRLIRDRDMLLKAYERNSGDARSCFYLGQVYACLGDVQNACVWYERRTLMLVGYEEIFLAHYRLGQLYHMSGEPWEKSLMHFCAAIAVVPRRAVEPLTRIAEYYWDAGDPETCFVFAYRAVLLPYPEEESLFIEKRLYDFHRYDLLAKSAWRIGNYQVCKAAARSALQARPDVDYVRELLRLCEQKIG